MKVSLEWLSDFVEITLPENELVDAITMTGIEVENVTHIGGNLDHVVVAEILSSEKHPSADRLSVCQVSIGSETRQIVCGAKNYRIGDKVPLALPGAILPGNFKIKESKLRGELSQGMMCSAKELELAGDSEGLLILDGETKPGTPLKEIFKSVTVLDLEITPNRPDLLSYYGLARELVTLGLAQWQPAYQKIENTTSPDLPELDFSVNANCSCYSLTAFDEIQVTSSPEKIKQRLETAGLRAINHAVDMTNYLMLEWGHPMHVFDRDKLSLKQGLHVRFAKPGEKLLALDHREYVLTENDMVIADDNGVVAIAGVIGGEATAVTTDTKRILLEVACFTPSLVRATSRRLNLSTDSSYRFERGVDAATVLKARNQAVHYLMGSTKPVAQTAVGHFDGKRHPIALRWNRVDSVLGIFAPREEIKQALQSLGSKLKKESEEAVEWLTPSWRPDLEREIDLIEETSRTIGLDRIPSRIQFQPSYQSERDQDYDRLADLKQQLIGLGFFEVVTSPLSQDKQDEIEIANPMTSDQTHLRASLKSQLLRVAVENWNHGNKSLRLFEIAKVFSFSSSSQGESWHLGLLLSGNRTPLNWRDKEEGVDYFDLKGVLESLKLPQVNLQILAPKELKALGIKQPVYYAEISLENWLKTSSVKHFKPWPIYPSSLRDIALVVQKKVNAQMVQDVFAAFQNSYFQEAILFDVYQDETGKKLSTDLKSMAYSIRYQSSEKTLTDVEVNQAHDRLKQFLKEKLNCEFRE
ncbi:MAG: phenylalanine--tRNA ligase subunit beta [Verrucomicrobiae bacterium]|nr:phenylalanine--tRNA ligase subunit beta [Verrucomicrobiae bacterium]